MKKVLFLIAALLLQLSLFPQNISVNSSGANPDASAILDVSSSSKGLLIPRMSSLAITSITNPAKGLLVLDTTLNQLMVNMGSSSSPSWKTIVQNSGWSLTGNLNTSPSVNFLGTKDNQPLYFRVNDAYAGQMHPNGNIFLGNAAGQSNQTGLYNTALGASALANLTGSVYLFPGNYNTAVGYEALLNTLVGSNTGVGYYALRNNDLGLNNTAVGVNALINNTSGSGNTSIGVNSGTTGSFNNTVNIGNNGWLNAYHNQVFIGNSSSTWIGGYVGWSIYSDGRIKNRITEDVKGLDFITKLRPVTYYRSIDVATKLTGNTPVDNYPQKYDAEKIKYSGFIAQEVEEAADKSGYEFSGVKKPHNDKDLYTLDYSSFVVPLVKAVQEQQQQLDDKQKQIDELKKEIDLLKKMISAKN